MVHYNIYIVLVIRTAPPPRHITLNYSIAISFGNNDSRYSASSNINITNNDRKTGSGRKSS